MTTWASVIAKGTVLCMGATDAEKKELGAIGAALLGEVEQKSAVRACKLKPDMVQYKKALAYLSLLEGIPMADAVMALVKGGRAVMTEGLHLRVRSYLSEPALASWLQLYDTVY